MQHSVRLKPQDVALLVKLLTKLDSNWRQVDLASELNLPQGEIAKSLARLINAGLVSEKTPLRGPALEFLVHAIKYVFPVSPGPLAMGVPTAISSPAHSKMVVQNDDVYVWPYAEGKKRGQAIEPFYPKLAEAALKDKRFYDIMSAIEILRIGRARERNLAEKFLVKELVKA